MTKFPLHTKLALTFSLSLFFTIFGCNSAHPEEPAVSQQELPKATQHTFSTNSNIIQLKPRSVFFPDKAQKAYAKHVAEQKMRKPAPQLTRHFFMTPEESSTAFSIGDTRDGYLINGQTLPSPSLLLRQLPVQYERGIMYGTPNLIQILVDTARAMEKKYPGTIMYLGNMGLKEGGDIPYSVSHNSGRDADIAFYFLDENGKQAHNQNMHKVNGRLQAHAPEGLMTFDIEKNTTLIETLLTHPKIHIQFIFAAKHIRSAIHKELVNRGASEELLNRFEVSVQNQAAHNDHFHIRIYCSPEDICAGCMDKSLIHEWQDDPVPIREKCISKHVKAMTSSKTDEDHKAAAIQRLALIGVAGDHKAQILKNIHDDSVKVRMATAFAARSLDNTAAQSLIKQLDSEENEDVRLAIIEALATYDGQNTRIAFNKELAKDTLSEPQLKAILKYITHHPDTMHLSALVTRFEKNPTETDVLLAISTIANQNFCAKTGLAVPAESTQNTYSQLDLPDTEASSESPAADDSTDTATDDTGIPDNTQATDNPSQMASGTISEEPNPPASNLSTSIDSNNITCKANPAEVASNDTSTVNNGNPAEAASNDTSTVNNGNPAEAASNDTSTVNNGNPAEAASNNTSTVNNGNPAEAASNDTSTAEVQQPATHPCLDEIHQWLEKNQHKSRNQWLLDGFKAEGFPVFAIDIPDVPFILDAIDGSRPVSINAQLALKKLSKLPQDSIDWSVADARWHYTRYFKRKAKKLKIDLSDRNEKGIKSKH